MIYAEVAAKGVTVYTAKAGEQKALYFPLPPDIFHAAERAGLELAGEASAAPAEASRPGGAGFSDIDRVLSGLELPRIKRTSVVLAANTHRTVIRVAGVKAGKKKALSPSRRWDLFRAAFPFGGGMNENTHIFDGGVFANGSGEARFFMAALPMGICELIARVGEALAGHTRRLARLDTAEHILFRRYAQEAGEILLLLPQEDGLRLLRISEGLPQTARYISNNPARREGEFLRFCQDAQTREKHAPARTLFLNPGDMPDRHWIRGLLPDAGAYEEQPFRII